MEKKMAIALYYVYFFNCALGISIADFYRAITVKNCGTSLLPPSDPDRIVGGKNAKHGQYPWMVSLHKNDGKRFGHVCGATVLNENWIITAAHCVDLSSRYQVLVGLHKQSQQNAATVQTIKISKIEIHKDYNGETYENDIALLRTAKPIDIAGSKGYVNGICLSRSTKDPTGYAKVIGWGHTKQDGKKSDTLKEVVVPIIPRDRCNEAYDQVKENMICAGMAERDSCQADSGGPLFQTNNKNVATLIGVVSYGADCGKKFYPGVYTKVSSYVNWIEKIMSK